LKRRREARVVAVAIRGALLAVGAVDQDLVGVAVGQEDAIVRGDEGCRAVGDLAGAPMRSARSPSGLSTCTGEPVRWKT